MTNKNIARKFFISENTVKNMSAIALDKLELTHDPHTGSPLCLLGNGAGSMARSVPFK